MAVADWIRPPRRALLLLIGVTSLLCVLLGWLGWRLLVLDRALESQQLRGRLESAADQLASVLRSGEPWMPGTVTVALSPGALTIPYARLPHLPVLPAAPVSHALSFARAESLEFRRADLPQAAALLSALAHTDEPGARAGALIRLGRVLRKAGQHDSALAVYRALSRERVAIDGLPAALLARDAMVSVLDTAGRRDAAQAAADTAYNDLLGGSWPVTTATFAFYAERLRSRLPADRATAIDSARASALAMAGALDSLWAMWAVADTGRTFTGQRSLWIGEQPVLMAWSGTGQQATARIRSAADDVAAARADIAGRRRLILLGLVTAALIVLTGVYAVTGAVHREIEVARLQSSFVSAVSHEFRTPLTTLRQLTEMLAGGRVANDAKRTTYYETIQREADRLHRLVEGLLDFGRMEAGALEFRPEPLDASAVVLDVVREFQTEVAERGYQVAFRSEDGACPVHADREAIGRAVWNLLDNAVKYSPDERAIAVNVGRVNGTVAIRVRDQGAGIPAAEQAHIFEKFVRGSASELRGVKGTGIGLAMVRHIVKAHGGDVGVESAPGHGSTFTIQLPVAAE